MTNAYYIKYAGFLKEAEAIARKTERVKSRTTLESLALKKYGIDDKTLVKELVELSIVNVARNYARDYHLPIRQRYDNIVALYQRQMNMSFRTSQSIQLQQYSTPAPIGYLMGMFVGMDNVKTNNPREKKLFFEPSAGNGLLTIAATDTRYVVVNEIDNLRRSNLEQLPYFKILGRDASDPKSFSDYQKVFAGVVTNPPFMRIEKQIMDGYHFKNLDHVMTAIALDTMADDGKAGIIVGGHTKYDERGMVRSGKDRIFMLYLYQNYNVVDVINIDGHALYSRQGTAFDTRLILINGRKHNEENYPPNYNEEAQRPLKSFDDLYERIAPYFAETIPVANSNFTPLVFTKKPDEKGYTITYIIQPNPENTGEFILETLFQSPIKFTGLPHLSQKRKIRNFPIKELDQIVAEFRAMEVLTEQKFTTTNEDLTDMELELELEAEAVLMLQKMQDQDGIGLPYTALSDATFRLNVETPDSMSVEISEALVELKRTYGDIDEWVRKKIGYATKPEMFKALAAEQIDGVALAIHNIEQYNQGIIIADQTGIGKGRQAAALIRYASLQGRKAIFLTEKDNLFSDMYRDLSDIGSPEFAPFIINSAKRIIGERKVERKNRKGEIIDIDVQEFTAFRSLETTEIEKHIKALTQPKNTNYICATYSQFQNGNLSDKNGILQVPSPKAKYLIEMSKGAIMILDEAHNAAGALSITGQILQRAVKASSGVGYLSATYAKRPDSMKLYALKTALSEAALSDASFAKVFEQGGVALQEVVSSQLVKVGQLIRRQRNFDGIEVNYITLDHEAPRYGCENRRDQHVAVMDNITSLIQRIIKFQAQYVYPYIDGLNDQIMGGYSSAGVTKGTNEAGVSNTPYFSKIFNIINQVLFALKAEDVADRAIQRLKEGKKPVIAFSSTMEAFIKALILEKDDFDKDDDDDDDDDESKEKTMKIGKEGIVVKADFSSVLVKGLEGVMVYTEKTGKGESIKHPISPAELGVDGERAYYKLVADMQNSVTGLVVSPIDLITKRIEDAGYTVAEVTGRKYMMTFQRVAKADATVLREGKPLMISDFNLFRYADKVIFDWQKEAIIGSEEHWDTLKDIDLQAHAAFGDKKDRIEGMAYLHFFNGSSDWYVHEINSDGVMFGYAVLNGDWQMAEWGYTSLEELKDSDDWNLNLDFYWTPKSIYSIIENQGSNGGLSGVDDEDEDTVLMGIVTNKKKIDKVRAFRGFNNNEIDVLLINQTGATGASAHAVTNMKVLKPDVKQRVMIVCQAELDINKEVQKRGRINRTGQIFLPIYDYVTSAIPAEKRFMMMLQKKLKSLDANTTSNQKNSEDLMNSPDFLNKYGDKVVYDFLEDNRSFADAVGIKDATPKLNIAHKVSGRVAVLKVKEQEEFYDSILDDYRNKVKREIEAGTFDLELETMDLDAVTLEKKYAAVGKGGRSAFGDNTYLELCEINNLTKPFTYDELINAKTSGLDGKTKDEHTAELVEYVTANFEQQFKSLEIKYENSLAGKLKAVATKAKALKKLGTGIDEYIQTENEKAINETNAKKVSEINTLNAAKNGIIDKINHFYIGRLVYVPLGNTQKALGVVVSAEINRKKKKVNFASVEFGIAVASSLRKITRSMKNEDLTELLAIIGQSTTIQPFMEGQLKELWIQGIKANLSDRTERHIYTGNIMQSYDLKDVKDSYGAKLIDYTTKDGKVLKGLLMPQSYTDKVKEGGFDATATEGKFINIPILKAFKIISAMTKNQQIGSGDGTFTFSKTSSGQFGLTVTNGAGRSIYTDNELIDLSVSTSSTGERRFVQTSGKWVADFERENLLGVCMVLDKNHNATIQATADQLSYVESEIIDSDKGSNEVKTLPVVNTPPINPQITPTINDDDLELELELEAEAVLLLQKQALQF